MVKTQLLSVITNQYLGAVPVFRVDIIKPPTDADNAKRQVLRSLFQPLVLYLVDHGHTVEAGDLSPETILNTVIGRTELQLDEQLVQEVKERYGQRTSNQPARDWLQESLEISLADETHLIKRLSQTVTGKLSEKARAELTKMAAFV